MSEGAITTLANLMTQIPGISGTADSHAAATTASLAMTSFGIPLTGIYQLDLLLDLLKDNNTESGPTSILAYAFDICVS